MKEKKNWKTVVIAAAVLIVIACYPEFKMVPDEHLIFASVMTGVIGGVVGFLLLRQKCWWFFAFAMFLLGSVLASQVLASPVFEARQMLHAVLPCLVTSIMISIGLFLGKKRLEKGEWWFMALVLAMAVVCYWLLPSVTIGSVWYWVIFLVPLFAILGMGLSLLKEDSVGLFLLGMFVMLCIFCRDSYLVGSNTYFLVNIGCWGLFAVAGGLLIHLGMNFSHIGKELDHDEI